MTTERTPGGGPVIDGGPVPDGGRVADGADERRAASRGVDGDAPTGFRWTPSALVSLRQHATRRPVALVAAAVVGLGLAWLHWLGLVAAGVLLGLPSRTVRRAALAAVLFGVVVIVVHVAVHVVATPGVAVREFLGLAPVSLLTVGVALVAPVWGALVRAVV